MANWSPPSIPQRWLVVSALLFVLLVGYSVIVVQQILLAVFPAFGAVALYLLWRFIVAFEAIADAQQRIAEQQEQN